LEKGTEPLLSRHVGQVPNLDPSMARSWRGLANLNSPIKSGFGGIIFASKYLHYVFIKWKFPSGTGFVKWMSHFCITSKTMPQ